MSPEVLAFLAFAVALFALVLIIALVLLPLFVWGIYNRAVELDKAIRRIEKDFAGLRKELGRDAENADAVARNIDANLALVSTAILERLKRGNA